VCDCTARYILRASVYIRSITNSSDISSDMTTGQLFELNQRLSPSEEAEAHKSYYGLERDRLTWTWGGNDL